MWGEKKPATPAKPTSNTVPEQPMPPTPVTPELYKPSTASAPPPVEARKMSPLDTSYPAPTSTSSDRATARLGQSLHFKGEISGNEDLHLDGSVEGLIHLEDRKLVIGASAKVTADVIAREVVVYGNVKGNLQARDRIEIKKDGSVVGDLTTARIMIEDGAYFKGSIEIEKATGDSESDADKTFSHASKTKTSTTS
jgi:cytoskeletal protein CcmA (bactofilin family)